MDALHIGHILFFVDTAAALGGQMMDAYTTHVGLALGEDEVNAPWLVKNQFALFGLKAVYALLPATLLQILGYDFQTLLMSAVVTGGVAAWGYYAGFANLKSIKVQKQYNAEAAAAKK